MKTALLAACLVMGLGYSARAETCRQALALGLDVSGSVDAREYRLQMDGLAQALGSTAVRAALLEQVDAPVELLIYEWSGPQDLMTLVPWTRITSPSTLDAVIAQLLGVTRREGSTPGTALGVAMLRGAQHLSERSHCWQRTLDISGDGKSNLGPRPRNLKAQIEAQGITINALVIDADNTQGLGGGLAAYFRADVILGPNAFVETANGFEDYAAAMEIKLLRELDGLVLSMK